MKIAIGTAQFGLAYGVANKSGKIGFETASQIISKARAAGVDMLDTAVAYGDSEATLGRVGVSDFKVVSKLPALPKGCEDIHAYVSELVQRSLRALDVSKLYGLLLHAPTDLVGENGVFLSDALAQLKKNGLVTKIGVSIYSPDDLEVITKHLSLDLIQAPLNVFDRRLHHSGWLQRLYDLGVEVHVRSVFLQGLLLMQKHERPTTFSEWDPLWARWDAWLESNQTDAVSACLGFVLSYPQVSRVVLGVDGIDHFDQILQALRENVPMPPEHLVCSDACLIDPSQWKRA